jgi:hypothetical protein
MSPDNGTRPLPRLEKVFWYRPLFQTGRGREYLLQHRRDPCRILWMRVVSRLAAQRRDVREVA